MNTSHLGILLMMSTGFASASAFGAPPPGAHEALTRAINNAIEWSKHIRTEVGKGERLDRTHMDREITGLRDSLKEITRSYGELSKQPAAETAEAHFVAIKTQQDKASSDLKALEAEFAKRPPDYAALKDSAKKIQAALESAAREHKAELSELDVP